MTFNTSLEHKELNVLEQLVAAIKGPPCVPWTPRGPPACLWTPKALCNCIGLLRTFRTLKNTIKVLVGCVKVWIGVVKFIGYMELKEEYSLKV